MFQISFIIASECDVPAQNYLLKMIFESSIKTDRDLSSSQFVNQTVGD